jgi:hypothetical protein
MGEAKIRQMAKAPVLGERPKFKDALGSTMEKGDAVAWIINGVKFRAVVEELVQPLVLADGTIEPGALALRMEFPNLMPPLDKHGKAVDVQLLDMIVTRAPEKPPSSIVQ